jgi:hypothetical protein
MMRNVMLDVRLSFDTGRDRKNSEEILLWFLGVVARLNLYYLKANPTTPKLYESGVRYALPDQMEECRVDKSKLRELREYLRSIGASDETAITVLRFVSGIEIFRDTPTLYRRGSGDCDNLTATRVAELWAAGISASPYLTSRPGPDGGTIYHALVLWPDGTSEDPSLILGMGGAARADERREEIRKNHERRDNLIQGARALLAEGHPPQVLGAMIDAYGLVPVGGFHS